MLSVSLEDPLNKMVSGTENWWERSDGKPESSHLALLPFYRQYCANFSGPEVDCDYREVICTFPHANETLARVLSHLSALLSLEF